MDYDVIEDSNGVFDLPHRYEKLYWNAHRDASITWVHAGHTAINLYQAGQLRYSGIIQQLEKADGICLWWMERGTLAPGEQYHFKAF